MANIDSPADAALRAAFSQRGIGEPDLKVLVGGETFFHNSKLFCRASEYFDRMLASDMRESNTMTIEFPDGDPKEWVRLCRYVEPRSTFTPYPLTAEKMHVGEEDAKTVFQWFHLFGMTNLLQECDERLSISSPKFLDYDLNNVNHQRSIMTEILVWADTAATFGLSETLHVMIKELKWAVHAFPEIITTEILEDMRPFWSTTAGTELWKAVKAMLPDDVKSSHDDAALKANKLLIELLAQSCKVPAQISTLKSEADFNTIANLMIKYRSWPLIQQEGCAAFQDPILRNDDNHISSAVTDDIEAIVSAMAAHSNLSKVQEWGCGALGSLACKKHQFATLGFLAYHNACHNDANHVLIAAKQGIEAIVSAMTAHSNVSKVQEQGCYALGSLACSNDANCVSIAAKHGIEAIVSSMTAHCNVSKVQELGCAALGILARHNDANCVLIAAKDGIKAIVSAMTAHSILSKVQEQGCFALWSLARNNDANRVSIAAKHGIEAIVSAMMAHSNVSKVQERGSGALGNLARHNDANCVSIAVKDGIEAIVSAMAAHSNLSEVQVQGCYALGSLACSNDANCVSIIAKDGIEAIVSAMTAHSNVSKVQEWGCVALRHLICGNDANCASIAAKHGIEASVSAMAAQSNVFKRQKIGFGASFNLSFNESVAVRIQLVGGLAVLEQNASNSNAQAVLQRIKA
jgi:hypothetical protein